MVRVPPASAAGLRLGEPERAERLPGAPAEGSHCCALGVGAEPVHRHRAERHPGLEGDGHRLVDLAELLQGQAQGEVVPAHAAVLLGEGQPEQTHLAHLLDHLVGEGVVVVVLGGDGRDHLAGEVPDGVDELGLLVGELGV